MASPSRQLISQSQQSTTTTSVGGYVTIAVFIAVFVCFLYLVRRHLLRFVSFYIFRRDYLRMSCVHQRRRNLRPQGEDNLNTDIARKMTGKEVALEYLQATQDAVRLYNPLINIVCPSRMLPSYLRLPRPIYLTLIVGSLIITLVLSLVLSQSLCQEIPDCLHDNKISLAVLDAVITTFFMMSMTHLLSKNYLQFMEKCRSTILAPQQTFPELEDDLTERAQQRLPDQSCPESEYGSDVMGHYGVKGTSNDNRYLKQLVNHHKVWPRKQCGPFHQTTATFASTTLGQETVSTDQTPGAGRAGLIQDVVSQNNNINGVGEYLYSIKEDDEEQPLSPQKQSMIDDIGSEEVGPGKPRVFGTILPQLGLIRVVNHRNHEEESQALNKHSSTTRNKGHEFHTSHQLEDLQDIENRGTPSALQSYIQHNKWRSSSRPQSQAAISKPRTNKKTKTISQNVSQITQTYAMNDILNKEIEEDKGKTAHSFVISRPDSKLSYKRFSMDRVRSNPPGITSKYDEVSQYQVEEVYQKVHFQESRNENIPEDEINKFLESRLPNHLKTVKFQSNPFQVVPNTDMVRTLPEMMSFQEFIEDEEDQEEQEKEPCDTQRKERSLHIQEDTSIDTAVVQSFEDNHHTSSSHSHRVSLVVTAIFIVGMILTPMYVCRALSQLDSRSLSFILLSFLYSVLLDLVLGRLIISVLIGLITGKLSLRQSGYQINNPEQESRRRTSSQTCLPDEEFNSIGAFYEIYDHGQGLLALLDLTEENDHTPDVENHQESISSPLEEQVAEDEEEGRQGNSALVVNANFGSTTRMLLQRQAKDDSNLTQQAGLKERVYETQYKNFVLVENLISHAKFPKKALPKQKLGKIQNDPVLISQAHDLAAEAPPVNIEEEIGFQVSREEYVEIILDYEEYSIKEISTSQKLQQLSFYSPQAPSLQQPTLNFLELDASKKDEPPLLPILRTVYDFGFNNDAAYHISAYDELEEIDITGSAKTSSQKQETLRKLDQLGDFRSKQYSQERDIQPAREEPQVKDVALEGAFEEQVDQSMNRKVISMYNRSSCNCEYQPCIEPQLPEKESISVAPTSPIKEVGNVEVLDEKLQSQDHTFETPRASHSQESVVLQIMLDVVAHSENVFTPRQLEAEVPTTVFTQNAETKQVQQHKALRNVIRNFLINRDKNKQMKFVTASQEEAMTMRLAESVIDPDQNMNELGQNQKLLRELILESSAPQNEIPNSHGGEQVAQEAKVVEKKELQNYLKDVDACLPPSKVQNQHSIHEESEQVHHSKMKQQEQTVEEKQSQEQLVDMSLDSFGPIKEREVNEQLYSPNYSSGNKSQNPFVTQTARELPTIDNLQVHVGESHDSLKGKVPPLSELHRKTSLEQLMQHGFKPDMISQEKHIKIADSQNGDSEDLEEQDFKQQEQSLPQKLMDSKVEKRRSSSHSNNLLKSVLSQHRGGEQESLDVTSNVLDITKSPRSASNPGDIGDSGRRESMILTTKDRAVVPNVIHLHDFKDLNFDAWSRDLEDGKAKELMDTSDLSLFKKADDYMRVESIVKSKPVTPERDQKRSVSIQKMNTLPKFVGKFNRPIAQVPQQAAPLLLQKKPAVPLQNIQRAKSTVANENGMNTVKPQMYVSKFNRSPPPPITSSFNQSPPRSTSDGLKSRTLSPSPPHNFPPRPLNSGQKPLPAYKLRAGFQWNSKNELHSVKESAEFTNPDILVDAKVDTGLNDMNRWKRPHRSSPAKIPKQLKPKPLQTSELNELTIKNQLRDNSQTSMIKEDSFNIEKMTNLSRRQKDDNEGHQLQDMPILYQHEESNSKLRVDNQEIQIANTSFQEGDVSGKEIMFTKGLVDSIINQSEGTPQAIEMTPIRRSKVVNDQDISVKAMTKEECPQKYTPLIVNTAKYDNWNFEVDPQQPPVLPNTTIPISDQDMIRDISAEISQDSHSQVRGNHFNEQEEEMLMKQNLNQPLTFSDRVNPVPRFISRDVSRRENLKDDQARQLVLISSNPSQKAKNKTLEFSKQSLERVNQRPEELKKVILPPPVYNTHLREVEDARRKKIEQERNVIIMEEQRRQMKKFLQLARQLRKGKDQKKIMNLLAQMQATGSPLPLSEINDLRQLEIMESPYSQSLQGMIKQIETVLIKKQDHNLKASLHFKSSDSRRAPAIVSRQEGVRQSSYSSTRKLNIAADAYGYTVTQGHLHQLNNATTPQSSKRPLTLSKESHYFKVQPEEQLSTASFNMKQVRISKTRENQQLFSSQGSKGILRGSSGSKIQRTSRRYLGQQEDDLVGTSWHNDDRAKTSNSSKQQLQQQFKSLKILKIQDEEMSPLDDGDVVLIEDVSPNNDHLTEIGDRLEMVAEAKQKKKHSRSKKRSKKGVINTVKRSEDVWSPQGVKQSQNLMRSSLSNTAEQQIHHQYDEEVKE